MSALDGLVAAAGEWRGSSTLQDPNTGSPDASESAATVTPVLGGRFVRLDYTWRHQGKPQEGSLLVGYQKKAGMLTAHWIDTFHTGDQEMRFTGQPTGDGTLTVRGTYPAPPGPDWGWRVDLTPADGALRIVHYNIWPEGKEELAVDSSYTRA